MATITRTAVLILSALLLLTVTVQAQRQRTLYDDRFFEPTEEVQTPHIRWATPYYSGPVRTLFITHRNAMREIVEIAQRLEMNYKVFAVESTTMFGETGLGIDRSWRLVHGNSSEELAERLRGDLKADYDLIVIGNVNWDLLPLDCRYEILRKVKEDGTGLVGYMPGGHDRWMTQIMEGSRFMWRWGVWSGAAQGIDDYFGIGRFEGAVDYEQARSGSASLRITGLEVQRGSRESPRSGYMPEKPIELEPNTEYVFSMWTRTEGLSDGRASVSLHPQRGGVPVPASDDWTYTEHTFTTDDTTLTTGLYLLNYEVGTVWYDDISLVKAGTDTNLVPNPGFESPGPVPVQMAYGVPHAALPSFRAAADREAFVRSMLEVSSLGKGRIAFLRYPSIPRHQMMTPGPSTVVRDCSLDYDYYLAFAIKVMLWGAQKAEEFAVEPLVESGVISVAPTQIAEGLAYKVHARRPVQQARMVLQVRDRHNRMWYGDTAVTALQTGENLVEFLAPMLPRGTYFADLFALSGDRKIAFGTLVVEMSGEAQLGEIQLESTHIVSGGSLNGTVNITGAPPGAMIRFVAEDYHGRTVADQHHYAENRDVTFSVVTLPALSLTGMLTVELTHEDRTLDVQRVRYSINDMRPDRDDIQFVMWMDYANDFIGHYMAREFTRHGIDSQYGHSLGHSPYENQYWLPYATRFTDRKTDWYAEVKTREPGDLVRDPCLTDPQYRNEVRETLTQRALSGLPFSTSDFTLGDENLFVSGNWDLCFSPTCTAHFREWAREQYGSLEALNESWGSTYTRWDDVIPSTLEEAKESGNLVPWVDHRLHMETVWAGIHGFGREVIREVVPDARVGYEGSDSYVNSFLAADFWKLSREMDLNNIYYRDFLSLAWNDFSEPGTLLGAGWFGGYPNNRNEAFMHWFPWRMLFKGSNSFWVWAGYGSAGAVMSYDLSLYPFFQVACDEIAQMRRGPAKLLIRANRRHDGIALLYSASSVHVATATEQFPSMNDMLTNTVALLHDCGLEARVVSYHELATEGLDNDEFRVLIVPGAQALSEEEIANIRRFAQGGGTVIADLRPGITNEHGKPYGDGGALDDLFGVRQAAEFSRGALPAEAGIIEGLVYDRSLRLAGGEARAMVEETPVFVSRQEGAGRALLLNCTFAAYKSDSGSSEREFAGWAESAPYRELMAGLLTQAGVTPPVNITPEAPRMEITRFTSGAAEYVGIIQGLPYPAIEYTNKNVPMPTPRPVTIDFGRQSHVYDVRSGRYLGDTRTVNTELTAGMARVFALMPYRLEALALSTNFAQVAPGRSVSFDVAVQTPQPQEHVIHVQVFAPDGSERPEYAHNLVTGTLGSAQAGRAAGEVHFAFNDSFGQWRITATDAATGVSAATHVQLALD